MNPVHVASGKVELTEETAKWVSQFWGDAARRLNLRVELDDISEAGLRLERVAAFEMMNALADAGLPLPGDDTILWARMAKLICDPKDHEEWSYLFGMAIQKRIDLFHFDALASLLIGTLANGSAEDTERIFGAAIAAKKLAEDTPHRNAWAFAAFLRFLQETGREPAKPELKDYIHNRREIYRGAPAYEDLKGWARLWKETKLWELRPKRPPKKPKKS